MQKPFLLFIEKKSPTVFLINGVRVSAKSKVANSFIGSNLRRALAAYYFERNKLSHRFVDSLVCRMLNSNHAIAVALENDYAQLA